MSLKKDVKKDCPAPPLTMSYDKKYTILIIIKILTFNITRKPLGFVIISNLGFCHGEICY